MRTRRLPTRGPWQTSNPFLFAVFHADAFPRGNGHLEPVSRPDGSWQMYHGETIPGFPQHPHRGFETLTLVLEGTVDHMDSKGNAGRYANGDLQWMTAGKGLEHSEMMPLLNTDRENPLVLFQIWLNLPRARKFVEPDFVMQWAEKIPVARPSPGAQVFVHAGSFGSIAPGQMPSNSMASDPSADVAVWRVVLQPRASVTLPQTRSPQAQRTLFIYHGSGVIQGPTGQSITVTAPIAVDLPEGPGSGVTITAGSVGGPQGEIGEGLGSPALAAAVAAGSSAFGALVLQGVPLAEPVIQHGPFVMSTQEEIRDAFGDYQKGAYGRWPVRNRGPTHGGPEVGRFARYGDRVEKPTS